MAALQYWCSWASVSTTTALKTICGIKAPTNQALKILEFCISFDGNVSGNAPIVVDLVRNTFGANPPGTASTSLTPVKVDPGRAETIQSTSAVNWSSEPTSKTIFRTVDVGAFNGLYHYINPFASPIIVVGGQGITVQVTAPNTCNTSGHFLVEE